MADHPDATEQERRTALYSTVNAGSPGEQYWNKSDGNNTVKGHAQEIFGEGSPWMQKASAFMGDSGPSPFEQVAQAPDSGMPMAPPLGAPMPAAYGGPQMSTELGTMDPTAMLGAFPLEGEPGAAVPPPEMVQAPSQVGEPEATKYVTGPQSFSTEVPAYSEQFTNPTAPYDWRTGPSGPPVTSPAPTFGAPDPGASAWNSIGGGMSGNEFIGLPSTDTLGTMTGPPGTVADPTQPNTYRPANTMFPQTQSPIQPPSPPMSPFNPATAPPLGGAPMSPEAMQSPNAMTDPFAVPPPLTTPPGIDTTHWAGFDPVQQMTNTGWPTASAYAPTVGGAPAPVGMGLPTPNPMGPERMYGGLPTPNPMSGGFNPTQAPTVGGAPEQTTMGVQNLANAYGFGAASPIGGYSPMQFKGGASNPVSMGSQQYGGSEYNPATFAGTGFTPQGGAFAGGTGPGGGPISAGVSFTPSGNAASSASMESHALQLMAAQDAAHRMNMANIFAKSNTRGPVLATIGGSDVMGLTGGIGLNKAIQNMWKPPQLNYGMNVGFGGGTF
jgi:hypothetical protein